MRSIRHRLLQSLLIGMVLIATLTGLLIYRHVRSELDELYNAQLKQIAAFMAREWDRVEPSSLSMALNKFPIKAAWDETDYLLQIWDGNGVLVAQEIPAATDVKIPLYPAEGLYQKRIGGEAWRIYRVNSARMVIQIAQPEMARSDTINETSVKLLAPLLLQVPLLLMVVWFSVWRGLKPLNTLSQAIALRQPTGLIAIDKINQPRELLPLVEALNNLLVRLDTALRQQKNFVADAAHELRTPLAVLQLQLDLLQRATLSKDRDLAITQLGNGLRRATHLIQQLLSIARAESTSQKLLNSNIELTSVIETIIERHLPFARARQLDLGVTRIEAMSIRCTHEDIEVVLDNLVSNAVRYTPQGGRVDIALFSDQSNSAVIEVTDTGLGIPVVERERVFDRFYRVVQRNFGNENTEGSGLGLAIVKTICDRYGAQISIGSGDEGNGTRITVHWPLGI